MLDSKERNERERKKEKKKKKDILGIPGVLLLLPGDGQSVLWDQPRLRCWGEEQEAPECVNKEESQQGTRRGGFADSQAVFSLLWLGLAHALRPRGGDEGATGPPCRARAEAAARAQGSPVGLEREGKQVRAPWEMICGGHGEPGVSWLHSAPASRCAPGQTSRDEAVALTPWKVPWRTLLLPKGSSLPGRGSPHPGCLPVPDVCGWSDVSLFMEWEPQRWLGLSGRLPGTAGGSPGRGGALLGIGGSPPLRFGCPLLQEALLGVESSPGHVSGSPGHRGLSWPRFRSTSAWGALLAVCRALLGVSPGHPGEVSWCQQH